MSDLWINHVSFSQLTAIRECPFSHFLLKAAGVAPVNNAFAEAGSLAHTLLASWARGELPIEQLPVQWCQRFEKEVMADFPRYLATKGYREKLFGAVRTYLEDFQGFPGYEIIGEKKDYKTKKSKGEIIDEFWLYTITATMDDGR